MVDTVESGDGLLRLSEWNWQKTSMLRSPEAHHDTTQEMLVGRAASLDTIVTTNTPLDSRVRQKVE